jgi:hypothetical protein
VLNQVNNAGSWEPFICNFPMINHLQFGFSQFISFREVDLWNFSQSEHITASGISMLNIGLEGRPKMCSDWLKFQSSSSLKLMNWLNPNCTWMIIDSNFVEDHPRNIPAKFGSNRPSGFGEEAWNVKSLQTTDDRRQTTDAKWWRRHS